MSLIPLFVIEKTTLGVKEKSEQSHAKQRKKQIDEKTNLQR